MGKFRIDKPAKWRHEQGREAKAASRTLTNENDELEINQNVRNSPKFNSKLRQAKRR